jgi:hypothetical protein
VCDPAPDAGREHGVRPAERLTVGRFADFVDHGSPFPLPPGPEGYAQILGFVDGVLRIRYDPLETIETDDRIVIRALAHGIGATAFHRPAADGKPYSMQTIHVYRTEGDRLAEHWGVRDEVGALIQLGVVPAPTMAENVDP